MKQTLRGYNSTLAPKPIRRHPQSTLVQTRAQARISPYWPVGLMTESKFQAMVEKDAHDLGWMASHSHLPYFDTAGWPDLALVHPKKHKFMVRELKVTDEAGRVPKPSPVQSRWLAALALAGVDTGVWTWPMDKDRYLEELMAA